MNSLDILIVNYHATDELLNCLETVYANPININVNVLIYDNNSHDDVSRITSKYPQACLIKSRKNKGFSKGVNCLIERSKAPYIMLLNPDTIAFEGLFDKALEYMDKNPDVGIVGPKVINNDRSTQGSARSFPSLSTAFFGRTSAITKLFPNNRISRANILTLGSDGEKIIEVDWVSGACMVVRRKAVEEIGGLDERFFMYWEDADWCKRMWAAEWKVIYNPQFKIMHHVGGSSSKSIIRSVFSFHRSTYQFFKKYNQTATVLLDMAVLSVLSLRFCSVLLMHAMMRILKFVFRIKDSDSKKKYKYPVRKKGLVNTVILKRN